jgi:hypothetical protein
MLIRGGSFYRLCTGKARVEIMWVFPTILGIWGDLWRIVVGP